MSRITNVRTRSGARPLPHRVRRLQATEFLALPAAADYLKAGEISFAFARCPRCGRAHDLVFRPLQRPIQISGTTLFTHWALCPATGEPILISFLMNAVLTEDQ
jgi:hypothetical protein